MFGFKELIITFWFLSRAEEWIEIWKVGQQTDAPAGSRYSASGQACRKACVLGCNNWYLWSLKFYVYVGIHHGTKNKRVNQLYNFSISRPLRLST